MRESPARSAALGTILAILATCAGPPAPASAEGGGAEHELTVSMRISASWSDWHGSTGALNASFSGKVARQEADGPQLYYLPKDLKGSGSFRNTDVDADGKVIYTEEGSGQVQIVAPAQAAPGTSGPLTLGILKGELGGTAALQMAGVVDPFAYLRAAENPVELGDLKVGVPIRTVRRYRDGREEARFAQTQVWISDTLKGDGSMRGIRSWRSEARGQTPGTITVVILNSAGGSRIGPPAQGEGKVKLKVTWSVAPWDLQVRIVKPKQDENFIFSVEEKKNLVINARAEATPKSLEDQVSSWAIDEIEGSELELKKPGSSGEEEPDWPEGPNIRFRFKGLPEHNSGFGRKTISCEGAGPVTVKVFYWKTEHDHPREETGYDEQDPNWFYYWKQGCVPGLERFEYLSSLGALGEFGPPDHLYVGDRSAQTYGAYSITLYSRSAAAQDDSTSPLDDDSLTRPFGSVRFPERKGCELSHATVLHELRHKEIYDAWIATGQPDADGDGLPDWFERLAGAAYALDPEDPDTHFLRRQISPRYAGYGDQELLCRLRERGASPVVSLDWSYEGKQSDPPE
jgi:hypothetical protein